MAILIAPRPIQRAMLKLCDLETVTKGQGGVSHILQVPRPRQPGQAIRSEFKKRKLIASVGVLLQRHVAEVQKRLAGKVPDITMAPMFPERMENTAPLEGFEGHCTATTIGQRLTKLLEGLGARSERTGGHLNMTVTRLRRTLATHAAMEGHGELIIADILDQSDTQNAGVYTEARPEIVERIDRKLAVRLAPWRRPSPGSSSTGSGGNPREAPSPIRASTPASRSAAAGPTDSAASPRPSPAIPASTSKPGSMVPTRRFSTTSWRNAIA